MTQARLIAVHAPPSAKAAVLVLHGGASRQASMVVSPTQLSVLRMVPIARRIARLGRRRLAVFRLLNTTRGWDSSHTPVDDVRWALQQIRSRYVDLPVGLVGHSLGGRAALLAAVDTSVRSVVALAPWVYPSDSPDLGDRQVLIVHGSDDRIALPSKSEAVARRLADTARVGYICIEGGKHAMLSHHRQFDTYAATFTAAVLCPDLDFSLPGPVRHVLEGQSWVTA